VTSAHAVPPPPGRHHSWPTETGYGDRWSGLGRSWGTGRVCRRAMGAGRRLRGGSAARQAAGPGERRRGPARASPGQGL